jgi:hypothetical protein
MATSIARAERDCGKAITGREVIAHQASRCRHASM